MKKLLAIFIVFISISGFLVPFSVKAGPGAWLSGWTYRKKITISNTNVDSSLSNFPLLVKITNDTDIGANALSDGSDIRFTDSDGSTDLSFEKEDFSINKGSASGDFWVKIPTILNQTSTDIYVYYKNPSPPSPPPESDTWDASYKGVWHLDSVSGPPVAFDSTSNNGNPVSMFIFGAGQIYNSYDFSAPGNVLILKDVNIPPLSNLSVSAWFKTSGGSGLQTFVTKAGTTNKSFWLGLNSDNQVEFSFSHDNTQNAGDATSTSSFSDDIWHFAEATYDGSDIRIYIDGTLETTKSAPSPDTTGADTRFGFDTPETNQYTGQLDDIRVSSIDRSSDWIKFESHNIKDSDNDISILTQESQADTTPPVATITSPSDSSTSTSASVHFEASATDETQLGFIIPNLDNSLVSWWRMDDYDSGKGTVNDYLTGTNCTNNNATQISDGDFGKAFSFNGSNSYLDCGNKASVQISRGTVASWVKTSDLSHGYKAIVAKKGTYNLVLSKGVFGVLDDKGAFISSGVPAINDGSWHYVALSFASGTNNISLYVDGSLATTTTFDTSKQGNNLFIGQGDTKGDRQFFNGDIDEVTLFNRILSQNEISALYDHTPIFDDISLSDGAHTYQIYASDKAGNIGDSGIINFVVDTSHNILGSGTLEDPYRISSCGQLQTLGEQIDGVDTYLDNSDTHIILAPLSGTNIDCSGSVDMNGGLGFIPLGDSNHFFAGTFDGRGNTIDGLTINNITSGFTGLFAGSYGTISNVGLTNVNISASAGDNVGSLVGENDGTINNSYSTGNILSSTSQVGGLVGYNDGTINNSYSTSVVSGGNNVGGLVGFNDSVINSSYSTGAVTTGDSYAGGLVGYCAGGSSLNSFWDVPTSGVDISDCSNDIGIGIIVDSGSDSSMKDSSLYINANWDFNNLWKIDGGINDGFPYLTVPDTTVPVITITSPADLYTSISTSVHFEASSTDETQLGFIVPSLDNSLLSWWRMDTVDGSGNPTDYSENNNGFAIGTAHQINNGKFGKGFSFDGSGYIQSGQFTPPVAGMTECAWIKPTSDSLNDNQILAVADSYQGFATERILSINPDGNISFYVNPTGNDDVFATGTTVISPNTWSFVCGETNPDSGSSVWVNGAQEGDINPLGTNGYNSYGDSFEFIGASSPYPGLGINNFKGVIDEVTMFDRALTSDEIQALYDGSNISHDSDISDGNHSYQVYASDSVGNVGVSAKNNFTIGLGPTIVSLSPENNSTDIATSTSFVVTFDKPVNIGSGYFSIKNSGDGSPVGDPVNVNGDQVSGGGTDTITITSNAELLNNTGYYVEIDPGAFKDLSNVDFAGITDSTTWTFTTSLASTIPDAPLDLTATSSDSKISLNWSPGANGGSEIINYLIEYKLVSTSTWTVFDHSTSTDASIDITGLSDSFTYNFKIAAINSIGTSDFSNTATETLGSISTPVITLLGSPHLVIYQGQTYIDAGSTAYDSIDHDISHSIASSTELDTSTPGTYTITYNVSNSNSIPAEPVTRKIKVISSGDSTPVLDNQGDSEIKNTDIYIPKEIENPKLDLTVFQFATGTSATATITKNITITKTMPSGDDVIINIFSSTLLTSSSSTWDGIINLPQTATIPTINPTSGKIVSTSSAIEIGLNSVPLSFNNGVRILFTNAGSKLVGYSQGDGSFVKITDICDSDTPNVGGIALTQGADCKKTTNNGNDLVVWTTHFTTYVLYSETPIYVPPTPSPVVYSGGGGGNYNIITYLPLITNIATTTSVVVSTSTVKQIQNATSTDILSCLNKFNHDIKFGMIDEDVRSLQKYLNQNGYIIAKSGVGSPGRETNSFGNATKSVLIKFQKENNIKVTGVFDAATRIYISCVGKQNIIVQTNISNPIKKISFNFTRDLKFGSNGEDVKKLQIFLNNQGFYLSKSGLGSPGRETTSFGYNLQDALKLYQKSKKIKPVNGVFGPTTRKSVLNDITEGD